MSCMKNYLYYKMTSENLSVSNLDYEELVLLQEIMMDVWEHGIAGGRTNYDKQMFDSLYEKIMVS